MYIPQLKEKKRKKSSWLLGKDSLQSCSDTKFRSNNLMFVYKFLQLLSISSEEIVISVYNIQCTISVGDIICVSEWAAMEADGKVPVHVPSPGHNPCTSASVHLMRSVQKHN